MTFVLKKCLGKRRRKWEAVVALILLMLIEPGLRVKAQPAISAPSAILIESSTGQIIYEKNSREKRSPASITKIMTLLLTMEALEEEKINLEDKVVVSEYASSMGGSQVYLAQGEVQTLDTMLKCIAVSSGNDASVAVAEHICGSEEAFVERMNERARELGLFDTHFEDCCGLTDSDNHYTTAMDVAIMSRELIEKHPAIYDYTKIWMDEIIHETKNGESVFGLSSTNKLLKQYQWTTGLKTGSTQKAKYCISATARKDDIDLVAVVMGADTPKARFSEAQVLLTYGFASCQLYIDKEPIILEPLTVRYGMEETVPLSYTSEFRYLDVKDRDFSRIERKLYLKEQVTAPIKKGDKAGYVKYFLDGKELGSVAVVFDREVRRAHYIDYLKRAFLIYLL